MQSQDFSSATSPGGPIAPEGTYVHSRGIRLYAEQQGPKHAPLVVFIHGFGGGCFEWHPVFHQLADTNLRLASVDLRGYGKSDKTPRGYDLTTAASDIAGVVRRLGYESATIVGHGYGGLVGWTLAAQEPERVNSLITISSAHPVVLSRSVALRPNSQWRRVRRVLFSQLPRLPEKRFLDNDAAQAELYFREGTAPGFRDTPRYHEHVTQRRQAMQVDKVAHLANEHVRWLFRSRFRPEGARFDRTFPTRVATNVLAIEGSMDPGYVPAVTRRSLERAQSGRAQLLYGLGHFAHVEDPEAVAALIEAHVTGEQK
ncbi:alpha/beta hydrolase [Corynebacterium auriscanis]|uniref:alpha/beta hydrolase n=1 Tax=Corynebacterium auriscanis TaxID=99807 RepID=UPI0022451B31|nr:alpha/beta hydrolase [Corynebacterium auriscanis]MCX2162594.1 alpha/beta hydrolase [Corynebacterium auriscanis]